MDKNVKWALIIIGAGAASLVVYKKFFITTKQKALRIIKDGYFSGDYNFLVTLDPAYVDAWYKAVLSKQDTFKAGGNTFATKGGKAQKAA